MQMLKRKIITLTALTAPLIATLVGLAPSASASYQNGEMFNITKSQCLDAGGGWLSAWNCNGSPVQIWTNISNVSGQIQFRANSGQCIDAGQPNGLFSCNGGNWQKFTATWVGGPIDGRYYQVFRNVQDPYACIDAITGDGGPSTGIGNCRDNYTYQWWSWQ
ncbi:hypothetical protein [Actinoallomurus sp. NPDC050550]|uniref:hypothetical protein n=1 Tax=Actinoallomurus sp. NPDC050550 TaxID=3154937 RepID=UPI0033C85A24